TAIEGRAAVARTYPTLDQVLVFLTDLSLPGLFSPDPSLAGKSLALRAEVLFDPIDKARMEEIRKWVEENSRSRPPDVTSLSSGLPSPEPARNRLFDKIYAQFALGASVAAGSRQTLESRPFGLDDLQDGK